MAASSRSASQNPLKDLISDLIREVNNEVEADLYKPVPHQFGGIKKLVYDQNDDDVCNNDDDVCTEAYCCPNGCCK